MNLRLMAESDLGAILEGDGWAIKITDPSGHSEILTGFSTDISQLIDPDTGMSISGRRASIALRVSTLYARGLTLPVSISDTTGKPWVIEFNDVNGLAHKFKIAQSNPDRAAGVITCLLELYE